MPTSCAEFPLFDQAEFVKHAADYVIPQLRYALPDVFNRQTSREEAGILNLDPIVENGDAQWRTTLRVIRMHDRVDDSLAKHDRGHRPAVCAADASDDGFTEIGRASCRERV